jgi:hypothetical protein
MNNPNYTCASAVYLTPKTSSVAKQVVRRACHRKYMVQDKLDRRLFFV